MATTYAELNYKTGEYIQKEIPDAPFYVTSFDKLMSYHGKAEGRKNICIVPCEDYEHAVAVANNVNERVEQRNVQIVKDKPKNKRNVLYSLVTGWAEVEND